jgi:hypothetical protein
MSSEKKMWAGTPDECDFCHQAIINHFIDGATRMGPWAIMCPNCHASHGRGLGTGRGQKYQLDPASGHFYKIEG